MAINVIKRDGSREPFDLEKISRVAAAAGLSEEKQQTLVATLKVWADNLPQEQAISSLAIRDKVIDELGKLDPYVCNMFTWYEKTKDK